MALIRKIEACVELLAIPCKSTFRVNMRGIRAKAGEVIMGQVDPASQKRTFLEFFPCSKA